MHLDFSPAATRGLSCYVRQVADALGLPDHGYYVQLETPANAYLALDGRVPDFPTHDAALTWDEVHGWAAAIEGRHRGADLVVVSYLGEDVLPAPGVVAEFTEHVLAGAPLRPSPTVLRPADAVDDLPARLADYASRPLAAGA